MNHLGENQQEISVFFRVQPQKINLSKGEFETQSHEVFLKQEIQRF